MTHIYLLAGAPAVGKSTTARVLATRFEKSVHISVDTIREMVVSGLSLPGSNWSQELIEQLALARESAIKTAITYSKAGFVVVLDDFWEPNSRLIEYDTLKNIHKILLFPSQQAAEERNQKRSGLAEGSTYIAEGIRSVYESLNASINELDQKGWIIMDTTDKTIEATVDLLFSLTK